MCTDLAAAIHRQSDSWEKLRLVAFGCSEVSTMQDSFVRFDILKAVLHAVVGVRSLDLLFTSEGSFVYSVMPTMDATS